jgi:RES domain-containing protein
MLVYRIGKCKYIQDLSGYGSFLNGGRWHNEGTHILYTSSHASLAMLEILAHFSEDNPPIKMCLITLEVPDKYIIKLTALLPSDWKKTPAPKALSFIGDSFIDSKMSLGFEVPSVLIGGENNVLINPEHPRFSEIKIIAKEDIEFDPRVFGK